MIFVFPFLSHDPSLSTTLSLPFHYLPSLPLFPFLQFLPFIHLLSQNLPSSLPFPFLILKAILVTHIWSFVRLLVPSSCSSNCLSLPACQSLRICLFLCISVSIYPSISTQSIRLPLPNSISCLSVSGFKTLLYSSICLLTLHFFHALSHRFSIQRHINLSISTHPGLPPLFGNVN